MSYHKQVVKPWKWNFSAFFLLIYQFFYICTLYIYINHIIFWKTPLFSSNLWALFLHFKTFKIQFPGVPLLHYVLVCKIYTFYAKNESFKGCVRYIFARLFYISKREHLHMKQEKMFFISLRKLFPFLR